MSTVLVSLGIPNGLVGKNTECYCCGIILPYWLLLLWQVYMTFLKIGTIHCLLPIFWHFLLPGAIDQLSHFMSLIDGFELVPTILSTLEPVTWNSLSCVNTAHCHAAQLYRPQQLFVVSWVDLRAVCLCTQRVKLRVLAGVSDPSEKA